MVSSAVLPPIRSAGCLVIGDEVLNGKIHDINSFEFAKFCFNKLSIPLKRTVVCSDDKNDIIECLNGLRQSCDVIITSGGIGSTHDDLTYEAVAAAYGSSVALHQPTVDRINRIIGKEYFASYTTEQLAAFNRMATLPVDGDAHFVDDSLWVPVVGMEHQVYILPGVPHLFVKLLNGLEPILKPRIVGLGFARYYVKTRTGESRLAPFLTGLQLEVDAKYGAGNLKLGSYPHLKWKINTISIIGNSTVPEKDLADLIARIVDGVGGDAQQIDAQEEDKLSTQEPPQ